jgi:hypothetical protein
MMTRTLIIVGCLVTLAASAARPPWDPWEPLDPSWVRLGEASNGVQLMARDSCSEAAAIYTTCTMEEPIDFRATNSAPERRCYRFRVVGPEAVAAHRVVDFGWQELPPSKPVPSGGTQDSIDPLVGRLEWGWFHTGDRCLERRLLALKVPPQGTCKDYNDAVTIDAVTGDWAFDWPRLLALAGTDEAGRSRLQELFGEITSVSGPGGALVPIEIAAGLAEPARAAPVAADPRAGNAANSTGSGPAGGLPANYLKLSENERLVIAAGLGIVTEVRVLLDAGANANTRDAAGLTALMRAAEGGHRAVVEALLAYGADPTFLAPDFRTAASIAEAAGHVDLVRLLAPRGPDKKPQ